MRDPETGELALGPHILMVRTQRDALAVLRDCGRFRQWDGSFRTRCGDIVTAGEDTAETDLMLVGSQSSLTPDTDAGPFSFAQTPIFLDQPRHTRFRQLLIRDWAVDSAVPGLEPGFRRLAHELIAGPQDGTAVEFMGSVAAKLSSGLLASFFGGSAAAWTDLTLQHPVIWGKENIRDDGVELFAVFQRHIWHELQSRIGTPQDDAMSRMIKHSLAGDGLTPAEIQTLVLQMAVVANESIIRMLGSVAKALAADEGVRRGLCGDGRTAKRFQAEVLKASPPVRGLFRRTSVPSSVCGLDIPADYGVFVDLKLASQDGAEQGHLAFGAGIHRCPGARLAMMAGSAVTAVLCEMPSLRICEGGLAEEPSGLLEGPSELWLEMSGR